MHNNQTQKWKRNEIGNVCIAYTRQRQKEAEPHIVVGDECVSPDKSCHHFHTISHMCFHSNLPRLFFFMRKTNVLVTMIKETINKKIVLKIWYVTFDKVIIIQYFHENLFACMLNQYFALVFFDKAKRKTSERIWSITTKLASNRSPHPLPPFQYVILLKKKGKVLQ